MMQELTADEHLIEKNQKMNIMHTYISTNTNLFENAVELLKSQNLAHNLQRQKVNWHGPTTLHVVTLLGQEPFLNLVE